MLTLHFSSNSRAQRVLWLLEELQLEYNFTDQRIYMHKYPINDFYSNEKPLGFWAGPHAQESDPTLIEFAR